jgi:hypothetical protein
LGRTRTCPGRTIFLADYSDGLTDVNLDEMTEVFKKHWFDAEAFRGLARLRRMESRSPDRYAEAVSCARAVGVGDYAEG